MNGIAICWPARSKRIDALASSGRIPIDVRPLQASIPGSPLALVAPDGTVQLRCIVQQLTDRVRIRSAIGDSVLGYELIAKPGTMRTSGSRDLGRLEFRWRAVGQLRYFDPRKLRPIVIDAPKFGGEFLVGPSEAGAHGPRFIPFVGGIPGLERDHPESKLVRRYVKWINSAAHFHHAQALRGGGFTDLFNTTRWTLFEAKASSEDRRIREAFGQLYDYKREFPRAPSLAVLLPERPGARVLGFLTHFGVAAVWKRQSTGFNDSVDGRLTHELRDLYLSRAR